jgi:hypothetical protein
MPVNLLFVVRFMIKGFNAVLLALVSATAALSASAQIQPEYTMLADYGDGSVQTFLASQTASIAGVRLVIRARGKGADVTVRLYDEQNNSLPGTFRTQGVLTAAAIPSDQEAWLLVSFDTPQAVTAGDPLALNVNQFNSGPTGFVDYGASTNQPYSDGQLLYESVPGSPLQPIFPEVDLAFEIVYAPEPAHILMVVPAALALRRRVRP